MEIWKLILILFTSLLIIINFNSTIFSWLQHFIWFDWWTARELILLRYFLVIIWLLFFIFMTLASKNRWFLSIIFISLLMNIILYIEIIFTAPFVLYRFYFIIWLKSFRLKNFFIIFYLIFKQHSSILSINFPFTFKSSWKFWI